uniref:G-protein coupled receptors family 1 profile domain-containing protein n=1 Tax=Plectus sambesii TaxID=2011161 RepID=A0A914WIN0_9BILA
MAVECAEPILMVYIRRVCDLTMATVGCILSVLHLVIVLWICRERKGRKFDYLLIMSAFSLLTLMVLASAGLLDLCIIPSTAALSFYRHRIWLFALNTLYCLCGYMVLVVCIDRCIALHSPIRYIETFSRLRIRVLFVMASVLIACLTNAKWFNFNQLAPSATVSPNASGTSEQSSWYEAVNALSCLGQYYIPGILMLGISVKNLRKVSEVRAIDMTMKSKNAFRLSRTLKEESQETIARICVLLAFCYCFLNWPNGIWDFIYTDARNQDFYYGIGQIIMNFAQAFNLLLNMFIFAYSSRIYRRKLVDILKWPFVRIRCNGNKNCRATVPLTREATSQSEQHTVDEPVDDLFSALFHHSTGAQDVH